MSTSPSYEALCTELQQRTASANAAHADLLARHELERIAGERAQATALDNAQRAHDEALQANEHKIADWAHRELAQAMSAWREHGSREAASNVRSKLATIRAEKLRLVGRDLWLEPGIGMCRTFPADAHAAFASWSNWATDVSSIGLIDPCHRVVVAKDLLETMSALEALEARCLAVARMGQRLAADAAEPHWAIITSGAPADRQDAARAELAKAEQQARVADWEHQREITRRARAGDTTALASLTDAARAGLRSLNARIFGPLAPHVAPHSNEAFEAPAP